MYLWYCSIREMYIATCYPKSERPERPEAGCLAGKGPGLRVSRWTIYQEIAQPSVVPHTPYLPKTDLNTHAIYRIWSHILHNGYMRR